MPTDLVKSLYREVCSNLMGSLLSTFWILTVSSMGLCINFQHLTLKPPLQHYDSILVILTLPRVIWVNLLEINWRQAAEQYRAGISGRPSIRVGFIGGAKSRDGIDPFVGVKEKEFIQGASNNRTIKAYLILAHHKGTKLRESWDYSSKWISQKDKPYSGT